jgi:uncharacterized protein (TIGR03000 family)
MAYSGCAVVHHGHVVHGGCAGGHVIHSGMAHHGHVMIGGTSGTVIVDAGTIGSSDSVTATEDDSQRPGTPVSTEEQRWLTEMLEAEKNAAEKRKLQEEFKKDSRAGRKATYDAFKKMKNNTDGASASAATIVVTLPASASLKIDGAGTTSTSTVRTFVSPTLTPGKVYAYTLEAEYRHNGRPVTVSKKVRIQAGKVSRVDLNDAGTSVASK